MPTTKLSHLVAGGIQIRVFAGHKRVSSITDYYSNETHTQV